MDAQHGPDWMDRWGAAIGAPREGLRLAVGTLARDLIV